MLLINQLISAAIQIFLFALIPVIWWCVTARKQQSFAQWIGLKKFTLRKRQIWIWTIGIALIYIGLAGYLIYLLKGTKTATSQFAGLGISAVPAILIYAIFNTAFAEELLFRGFLLKRLSSKFGFALANVIQAALFGLLHGLMFFSLVNAAKAVLITAATAIIAWTMGYINEKQANGSIIPSWIIHSISNLLAGICAAFLII